MDLQGLVRAPKLEKFASRSWRADASLGVTRSSENEFRTNGTPRAALGGGTGGGKAGAGPKGPSHATPSPGRSQQS